MKRFSLVLLCFSSLLCSAALCETPAQKHLKVGAVLGLTGGAAYHSQGIRHGLELAKRELEEKGWRIDLRYEDDQTEPKKTVSAFQYLLSEEYRFFIGPTWSFQAAAVRSLLPRYTAVALVPAGSSEINGGPIRGMFSLCPSREQQVPYITRWLKEKAFKRAYILTANGDWGEVHAKVFRRAVESSGGTIVGDDRFDYGSDVTTLSTLLTKVQRAGADLVMTTGGGADVANVVRARNISKFKVGVLSTNDIRDALHQGLVARSDLADVYAVGLTVSPEFEGRFMSAFGTAPSLYSDRAYDALTLLAHAVERTAGSPGAVRDYLSTEIEYPGVFGPISFDSNGDVKNGRYQIVSALE